MKVHFNITSWEFDSFKPSQFWFKSQFKKFLFDKEWDWISKMCFIETLAKVYFQQNTIVGAEMDFGI